MLRVSDKDVWEYYCHHQKMIKEELTIKQCCDKYKIHLGRFISFVTRYRFKKLCDPTYHKVLVDAVRDMQKQYKGTVIYARENNLNYDHLAAAQTHVMYVDKIEELKIKHGYKLEEVYEKSKYKLVDAITIDEQKPQKMNFLQVNPQKNIQEVEVIHPKNDVEIIISKGVRVIISPNIEPLTMIKIIELLKEI